MDPEVVGDIKDAVGMVIDKCSATQNWEVRARQKPWNPAGYSNVTDSFCAGG
jgi:hypothetical protein